ncbi:MAG TPA: hypothetical protein EYN03_10895 [Planctomycetes bacterium]|nr:hypothetical protein [Planctomycetota bacterium]
MLNLDVISIYILTLALLALVFGVFVNNRQKNGKTLSLWLASTILGLLLGATGALGACYWLGYEVVEKLQLPDPEAIALNDPDAEGSMTPGGGGPGGPAGSPAGGAERGSRGGSAGRGSSRQVPARFQLMMLVRKLELLTGDVAIKLSDEQASQVHTLLKEIEAAETLSDEDAQQKHDALLALMEDAQKAKTEAVSIPFRRGSSGGRGGSAGNNSGGRGGSSGTSGAGNRGASAEDNTNLFREGSSAEAIQALLGRLGPDEEAEKK